MGGIDTVEYRAWAESRLNEELSPERRILRLCDALDACRKERDEGFALRDLALEKAVEFIGVCPTGKEEEDCAEDMGCEKCYIEFFFQQAAKELAERSAK
jgi:hypothetical protein